MSNQILIAEALMNVINDASMATDAGVVAVFLHLASKESLPASDIATELGIAEDETLTYLSALGAFVVFDGTTISLSNAGLSAFERAVSDLIFLPPGGIASAKKSLPKREMARWEEIKHKVMNTPPDVGHICLKDAFSFYYKRQIGEEISADEERLMGYVFSSQGDYGLSFHPAGTTPFWSFGELQTTFGLEPSDEKIIRNAVKAGQTFW